MSSGETDGIAEMLHARYNERRDKIAGISWLLCKMKLRAEQSIEKILQQTLLRGGGGGIRTPETLSGLTVFKTAGFNHSPTPPLFSLTGNCW
jgi:hypothetical protein